MAKKEPEVVAKGHGRGYFAQLKFAHQVVKKYGGDALIKFEEDGDPNTWTATVSKRRQ